MNSEYFMNRNGPILFRLQVYIFACKATSVRGKIGAIGVPGPARASFMKGITVRYVWPLEGIVDPG